MRLAIKIFAALFFVALVSCILIIYFLGPFSPRYTPKQECWATLKQIEGAKGEWAWEQHKTTNDIPLDADLFGTNAYIRFKPVCPEGGTYRLGRVGEKPTCSVPGHILPY